MPIASGMLVFQKDASKRQIKNKCFLRAQRRYLVIFCFRKPSRIVTTTQVFYTHAIVMGWQNRLKFSGKTNRLKILLQNAYFYYFGQFRVFL